MKKLVIRHHNPKRVVIAFAVVVLTGILSTWGMFEYGRSRAGFDFASFKQANQRLLEENASLQEAVGQAREKGAVLERTQQIEREAYKQLETTIAELQKEVSELKGELAFYRSIVTPAGSSGGLRIQAFEVENNGLERGYRYKLVLTQVMKNDTVARGRVDVAIEGRRDGHITSLQLGELDPKSGNLDFRFKYFQNFEGNFQVPAGFSPVRVIVKVTPGDSGYKPVEKVFDWPT